MSKKIEYYEGQQIGEYGVIFLRDSDKYYISKSGNKYRQAYFLCPYCHNEFLSLIQDVKKGKRSCGCMTSDLRAKGGAKTGIDISGQRFGKLVAKYFIIKHSSSGRPKRLWYCQCDCGGYTWTTVDSLLSGHTLSCGCLKSERARKVHTKDITGFTSGLLTAKYNTYKQDNRGNYIWYCTCQCGGHKEVSATHIINKMVTSCGCIISKGESLLKTIFTNLNISYQTQFSFKDCINPKTKALLKFDFYLPDYNCCIEYDGEQHFFESGTWAEKEGLDNIQFRDRLKDNYCKQNNISLIRIKYTSFHQLNETYILQLINQAQKEGGIIRG